MNKTGTTTLRWCFVELGLDPIASPSSRDVCSDLLTNEVIKRQNYAPALRAAARFRSFADRPWNVWQMYRKLDRAYPSCRFILTERDPERWWKSVRHWLCVTKADCPGRLPLYLEHLEVDRLDKERCVGAYLEHNAAIKNYFRGRSDLLVIDFEKGAGWPEICSFIGVPIPSKRFPHRNRQNYGGS